MPLRALTLRVDASRAEALSEALLEAGAQSVAVEELEAPQPVLCALFDVERDPVPLLELAAGAAGLTATPPFRAAVVADDDWVRRSQAQFAPVEIGERLWIGPTWHEAPQGRVAVRLDPGLAFGTGSHATTKLVLAFLEQQVRGAERLLDYGCGSGILAIAAAKLGAAQVDAVDIDPQAVQTALENARANGIELRATLPDELAPGVYDIVVSNILFQPLIALAPLLAARSTARGHLALAGILEPQADEVAAAYEPWFDIGMQKGLEGWALVAGRRR